WLRGARGRRWRVRDAMRVLCAVGDPRDAMGAGTTPTRCFARGEPLSPRAENHHLLPARTRTPTRAHPDRDSRTPGPRLAEIPASRGVSAGESRCECG